MKHLFFTAYFPLFFVTVFFVAISHEEILLVISVIFMLFGISYITYRTQNRAKKKKQITLSLLNHLKENLKLYFYVQYDSLMDIDWIMAGNVYPRDQRNQRNYFKFQAKYWKGIKESCIESNHYECKFNPNDIIESCCKSQADKNCRSFIESEAVVEYAGEKYYHNINTLVNQYINNYVSSATPIRVKAFRKVLALLSLFNFFFLYYKLCFLFAAYSQQVSNDIFASNWDILQFWLLFIIIIPFLSCFLFYYFFDRFLLYMKSFAYRNYNLHGKIPNINELNDELITIGWKWSKLDF